MHEIWANRLIAGTKKWTDVPEARREGVRAVLDARVSAGTLSAVEAARLSDAQEGME